MRIKGVKARDGHYYITAIFACQNPELCKPALFLVDTGATITTIIAEKFEVDCSKLSEGVETTSSMGIHIPRVIQQAFMIFRTIKGKSHIEFLKKVDVIDIKDAPFDGLMGMDILSRFKIRLDKNGIFLEK